MSYSQLQGERVFYPAKFGCGRSLQEADYIYTSLKTIFIPEAYSLVQKQIDGQVHHKAETGLTEIQGSKCKFLVYCLSIFVN